MDNADRFADKFTDKWVFEKVANQQTDANAGGSAGSRTPDHLIKSPLPHSNISDLTPKSMQTNADKALECRQNADKFNRYYSLPGNGINSTATREWGEFLGGCLTVKN